MGLTPMQVLAQILRKAREEKEKREAEEAEKRAKEEASQAKKLIGKAPPGFLNKISYYSRLMTIMPDSQFKGFWDLLIFL